MRSMSIPLRPAAILSIMGLAVWSACSDGATGPDPSSGSLAGLSGAGISIAATTHAVGVPVVIWSTFRVINHSVDPLALTLSGPCPAGLRLYADADRAADPVWDSRRLERCALEHALQRVVAPGDSLEEHLFTNEAEILGDSLPAGRYYASATLVAADGTIAELATIAVDLTGAELVDVSVRRGEEVVVPGTTLRIGLLDVTDDQRCPVRDRDGNPILCIWQGNVDLTLALAAQGEAPVTVVMRSGFAPEIAFGPFLVRFFGLKPERIEGVAIDPDAYEATLRVVVPR